MKNGTGCAIYIVAFAVYLLGSVLRTFIACQNYDFSRGLIQLFSAEYIRLDAKVAEAFRVTGVGWKTRINNALKDWLKEHRP